jgi:hypothetical protein
MYSDLEKRHFFHNAFSFFKKETLKNFPFDEKYGSKEDRYWIKTMVDNNKKFLYDPDLVINHFYTKNGATWTGIG